jgi:undecaprenyl-diphosphatase
MNGVPDSAADAVWPIMQLGTVAGPVLVGVVVLVWKRSWPLALCVVASGTLAWFLAKGVKRLVERGRPLEYLPDITVHEGSGTGLGFVSGHTAVAFAMATVLAPDLPRAARVAVFTVASLVGLARILHGVHLPADVLGGAGLGVACGVGVRASVERLARTDTARGADDARPERGVNAG